MSDSYISSLRLRTDSDPDPAVQATLRATKQNMGMIPNMYAAMANVPAVLETYQYGYRRFREESGFSPAEQEVVFLTISRAHRCHYCMAAHTMAAETMSNVPQAVTDAIRNDRPIDDGKLEALRAFTRIMVDTRGNPSREVAGAFLAAGYSEAQILAIILAVSVKVLSNYTNHIFDTEPDAAFANRAWTEPELVS